MDGDRIGRNGIVIAAVTATDLERFRGLVTRRLGLQFDDTKVGFLAEVLRRRLDATKEESDGYLAQLEARTLPNEVTLLAQELTVAETYFFRYVEQYRAFAEAALPDRLRRAQASGTRLSIVSAGCASGEEPYSLAIAVRNAFADRADSVSIVGVDINPALLEKAARGRFSAWVLRETPPDVQRRWFQPDGRDFVLDGSMRSSVRFEVCNLADDRVNLWHPEVHDVVFCRNVLMYFDPASAQALVNRIARSLRPGGYLFLGHAETLRGLSTGFHLRHTHGTFYYQRREGWRDAPAASEAAPAGSLAGQSRLLANCVEEASTWIDTIDQASARIRRLAESPQHRGSSDGTPGVVQIRPAREIALALELLREERFAEALELVQAFPPGSEDIPEVLLLRAVLLTHGGRLDMAERACEQLLRINELNAEAHYLLALCREGAGDNAGSLYHDQVAVYLDPTFAMAHLHLGLLARRARDRASAKRELEQAIVLLRRTDASHLLLFGGGFSRDALVGLCRTALPDGGGWIEQS